MNGALAALNQAATVWDSSVDALVEVTRGIQAAAEALHQFRPTPDVYQKAANAKAVLLRIIEERTPGTLPIFRRNGAILPREV